MSFKSFLKDRITYIILILFASITSQILLLPSEIAIFVRIYVGLAPIILFLIYALGFSLTVNVALLTIIFISWTNKE